MADYAQSAISARAKLKKDGQLVRVRVYTDTNYDANNSLTVRTWEDTWVYGVVFNYGTQLLRSKSGEDIEQGDKWLMLAADVVVTPGNTDVMIGTVEYKVIGVSEINPAGILVMYDDIHLRK
jgi:hypothetical protein